jgi:hypothetical protein
MELHRPSGKFLQTLPGVNTALFSGATLKTSRLVNANLLFERSGDFFLVRLSHLHALAKRYFVRLMLRSCAARLACC